MPTTIGKLTGTRIDSHVHVGLIGDSGNDWGSMSEHMRSRLEYRVFLAYGRIDEDTVCDRTLREATVEVIDTCGLDHVVCLALDPVFDHQGVERRDLSHLWVANDYVVDLRRELGDRVLLGASVHPYDPTFSDRVRAQIDQGAVLLKWLPSVQGIDLADPRAGRAMRELATIGPGGGPLPLLLHIGAEYAIPAAEARHTPNDFLSWTRADRIRNLLRFGNRWDQPDIAGVHANLRAALAAGAVIIFAHCGLPYFTSGLLSRLAEHSDFEVIREHLNAWPADGSQGGRCLADVSACCTPFRQRWFSTVERLPRESLIVGSDFPTPVFELSADLKEAWRDFKAMLHGDLWRLVIPQDNLLDVNARELGLAFPGHPMAERLGRLLDELGLPAGPA